MTPGAYLRQRRTAASLSLDELPIDGTAMIAIERDLRAPTNVEVWALACAFDFDVGVLVALALGSVPQLCRECGCSERDACDDGGIGCCWIESDLCSACAPDEQLVTCSCGADVDSDIFSECHECGSVAE